MKKLFKLTFIFLLVLLFVSCADTQEQMKYETNHDNSGYIVKYNDKLYYYVLLQDNTVGICEYDMISKNKRDITQVSTLLCKLFIIQDRLYYVSSESSDNCNIYSINLQNTFEAARHEAYLNSSIELAINFDRGIELEIFKTDELYVFVNKTLYRINNGIGKVINDNLISISLNRGYAYYSTQNNEIGRYNIAAKSNELLLLQDQLLEDPYVQDILGGIVAPVYVKNKGNYIYYLAVSMPGLGGKLYKYNMYEKDNPENIMNFHASTYSYKIHNDKIYYINDGAIEYIDDQKRCQIGVADVVAFNIYDDTIYYCRISEEGYLKYFYTDMEKQETIPLPH